EADGGRRGEEARAALSDIDARLARLDADVTQGQRNLALLPPDLLPGVVAQVRAWREERERLAAEGGGRQKRAEGDGPAGRRVAEALGALEALSGVIDKAPKSAQRKALAALVTKVTVHFDHARPHNRSHAHEVTVEWVFHSPHLSPSEARRRC